MNAALDCVVVGSCVVDLLCRPVSLTKPIGGGKLYPADPIQLTAGGITSNSGITLARMGLNVGVFSYVGDDAWGPVLRNLFADNGVNTDHLVTHETAATSTTVVAIDTDGERSFFHCVGAPKRLDAQAVRDRMGLFTSSRAMLLGYYSLMPNLEPDLPELLAEMRQGGCMTAMDAAGDGGTMEPLDKILPELDVYVPSMAEAEHQTGEADPEKIIAAYRACNAPGILGVKLGGTDGVLLSDRPGEYVHAPSVSAPGDVIDTTGAGDSFYAGLIAGLLDRLPLKDAGRLGCAAGACSVTAMGGYTGARSMDDLKKLLG